MVIRRPFLQTFCFLASILFFVVMILIRDPLKSKKKNKAFDKPLVLSTIAPLEALVHSLAGDYVHSVCLIPSNLDPHTYQLRKGDADLFSLAKLIVYNGLGLEHGASLFQKLHQFSHAFSIGSCLSSQEPLSIIYSDGVPDPHIWLDIQLLIKVVNPLTHRLIAICPDDKKSVILKRAQRLIERLQETDSLVRQLVQEVPDKKRYLVSAHSGFNYFVRSYLGTEQEKQTEIWSKRYLSPEGLAPEAQVSFSHIQEVFEFVLNHDIHVLFPEVNVPSLALVKLISMATRDKYALRLSSKPLYSDSFPNILGESDHIEKYIEIMIHNARSFRDAFLEGDL